MTRTQIYLVAAIPAVFLLLLIVIPHLVPDRVGVSTIACVANLRMIERAKNQWATETQKTNHIPTEADLLPFFGSPRRSTN